MTRLNDDPERSGRMWSGSGGLPRPVVSGTVPRARSCLGARRHEEREEIGKIVIPNNTEGSNTHASSADGMS
jgi:hypothetical protein